MRAPCARPLASRTVHVAGPSGEPLYAVTNFVLPVLEAEPPRSSDEMEAVWIPLAEAATRRPMAAGTRRVIRNLPGS